MSEESVTYTSLPEDLELLTRGKDGRPGWHEPTVTFSPNGIILNKLAWNLAGNPKRADVFLGQQSRMVAIRPTDEKTGYACHEQGRAGAVRILFEHLLERLGLQRQPKHRPLRMPAHLVEGALLIGPLPEAKS